MLSATRRRWRMRAARTMLWSAGLWFAAMLVFGQTTHFTLGLVLWLIYGVALGDWPLIGSNVVTLALMLVILSLKLRYG